MMSLHIPARDWISVTTGLPETTEPVMAALLDFTGAPRRVIARYIPSGPVDDPGDLPDAEFNEETELYFIPGGWYVDTPDSDTEYALSGVEYWTLLPELPPLSRGS